MPRAFLGAALLLPLLTAGCASGTPVLTAGRVYLEVRDMVRGETNEGLTPQEAARLTGRKVPGI
jgi:hypothetical protein